MTTFTERLLSLHVQDPAKTALILQRAGRPDLTISYGRLVQEAAAYERALSSEGTQPGEVVVLILQHGEDLVYAYWGAVLHGAVPSIMPFLTEKLSPDRYRAELAALVSVTQPAAILTYPEFESEVRAALGTGGPVRSVIVTGRLPISEEPGEAFAGGRERREEDIVLLQHSSGTTGLQKGVALSHRAVFNQLEAYGRALGLNAQDVIVSWLPLYHDMGLIAGFLMPLLAGVPLVLSSPFDWVRAPQSLLHSVTRYRGTLTWLPNFAYNFLAHKTRPRMLEGVDLSSWRAVINCSEPVRVESHRAFREAFEPYGLRLDALQTCYAMAENVFAVTQSDAETGPRAEEIDREAFMTERLARSPREGQPSMWMMSSGRPILNTRVRVLDAEGRPVPERVVGEIALQSDCMLTGYYHRPAETEKSIRDGWYLTGDYGYLSEGELFVAGRKKDMIIVGGKNVYPQDLESLTYEVPGVHSGRSVAFGLFNDDEGTEEVVIIVEAEEMDAVGRERLAGQVSDYVTRNSAITPRAVEVVGPRWIIKTSSGKTARAANREKYLHGKGLDAANG